MSDKENTKTVLVAVKIVTPGGGNNSGIEFECDSVHLNAQEDAKGNNGGSFGVRYGHADALAALQKGKVEAYLNGEIIKTIEISGGFAKIRKDSVTVITEGYKIDE